MATLTSPRTVSPDPASMIAIPIPRIETDPKIEIESTGEGPGALASPDLIL